jgi:hypothetical protein
LDPNLANCAPNQFVEPKGFVEEFPQPIPPKKGN